MAITDQTSNMSGLTNNPGMLIDPKDFVSGGMTSQTNGGTRYYGGDFISATGPDVQLFETGWYSEGTFRDNVILRAVFDCAGISNYTIAIRAHIHSRYPDDDNITTSTIYFAYDSFMSPSTGSPQQLLNFDSRCTDYLQFDPRKEYKFEFFTGSEVGNTDTVGLDYIFAQYMPRGNILHAEEQGLFYDPYGGINYTTKEPITITESFKAQIPLTTNGTLAKGTLKLERVPKGEAIGDNKFVGYYKKIDNVFIQPVYDSNFWTNNRQITIMVDPSTLDPNDGITNMSQTEGCYAPTIYATVTPLTVDYTINVMVHITGKVAPKDV